MSDTFELLGYLSPDIDGFRTTVRSQFAGDLAVIEGIVAEATAELRSVGGTATEDYLVGAAFWLRCIECCQATVLLAERGLAGAPYATLRTAFECLFTACALWRSPHVAGKLEAWHHKERIKQARALVDAGETTRLPAGRLDELRAVAAETPPACDWSHHAAACIADLRFEYEMIYRGLGIAGAHATPRSLDEFHEAHPDGSFTLRLEPTTERLAWLLSLVRTCLALGIARHREALSSGGA